jgi:hypothetical protein
MMGAERSRAEEARGSTPSRGAKTHWLQAGQTYGDVGAPDVHGASRFFSYRCGAVQAEYAAQHDEARSERNMAWIDRCSWCNTDWPWWWASPLSSHCPRTSLAWRRAEQIPFSFLVAAASKQNKAPPPPACAAPTHYDVLVLRRQLFTRRHAWRRAGKVPCHKRAICFPKGIFSSLPCRRPFGPTNTAPQAWS